MESFTLHPKICKRFDKISLVDGLDKGDNLKISVKQTVTKSENSSSKTKLSISNHNVHYDLYKDGQKKIKLKNQVITVQEEKPFTFTPIITKNSKRLTKKYLDSANMIERLAIPTFNEQMQ